MNTENYKNKRREAKKICKKKIEPMTLRCWKVWGSKKILYKTRGMEAGYQPQISICKDRDNN